VILLTKSISKEGLEFGKAVPRDEVEGHDLQGQVRLPHRVLDVAVAEDQVSKEQGRHQEDEDCVKRGVLLDELSVVGSGALCNHIFKVVEHIIQYEVLDFDQLK
jgi:hypothetical protein